jgi:hypothetical protein
MSLGSNISLEQIDGGMGNLADELEDALEDEYEAQGSSFLDDLREGSAEPSSIAVQSPYEMNDMHDFGFGMAAQSPAPANEVPNIEFSSSALHMP